MTVSAPRDFTSSTFAVLQTPVTSAPRLLRVLHRRRARSPRGPVDEHSLAGLDVALLHELQRQQSAVGRHGRLLVGQVRRLQRQAPVLRVRLLHALVLGVGAEPEACEPVDLVAGLESLRVAAHRHDLSRQHQADDRPSRLRDAHHQAHGDAELEGEVGPADEDVAGRHRGRHDPYADLVVLRTGLFHFSQLEDVRSSVSWAHDRSHGAPPHPPMSRGYREGRRREPPGGGGCGRPAEGFRQRGRSLRGGRTSPMPLASWLPASRSPWFLSTTPVLRMVGSSASRPGGPACVRTS